MGININQFYRNVDCPREFVCAYCGVRVYVTDLKDKRVRFCCDKHCENYHKHKERYEMKPRGRETSGLRNYSAKDMAIKLYKEKKEAEEMDWKERKDG